MATFSTAKNAFRENINSLNPDKDKALYNLSVGLLALTENLERDALNSNQILSRLSRYLQSQGN